MGSLLLSPGSWCTRLCLCPPRVYFPVHRKFRRLRGGVTGDLLLRLMPHPGLLHPEPLPLRRAMLTRSSAADAQTQFWLSLCGVPGSWCAQALLEPSERFWRVWGLSLNANSPLLPSCWGFSFALGRGVSPRSCSSRTQPLPSFWGFSTT